MRPHTKYLTVCPKCRAKRDGNGTLMINGYSTVATDGKCIVPGCGGEVDNTIMTTEEYNILTNIDSSVRFIESMIKLKEENIIDFNFKMSQFKVNSQTEDQNTNNSILHCPTCGSTNIRKIGGVERGASIAAFGIFSKKINKTFKCENCGYTW